MILGGLIVAAVLVIVLPVSFLMSGAAGSVVIGYLLKTFGDDSHPDSELIETNY